MTTTLDLEAEYNNRARVPEHLEIFAGAGGHCAPGLDCIPVVVGGITSNEDALVLSNMGVSRVYTPKDYELDAIMGDIVGVIRTARRDDDEAKPPPAPSPARGSRRERTGY